MLKSSISHLWLKKKPSSTDVIIGELLVDVSSGYRIALVCNNNTDKDVEVRAIGNMYASLSSGVPLSVWHTCQEHGIFVIMLKRSEWLPYITAEIQSLVVPTTGEVYVDAVVQEDV